ncbi:bifunctional glutamate N-acetyltransferase/amino-acid acetyltransferase ArgJ [Ruegeria sp. 2205SS24-7]|uniref:bifunctional glutamate N-acetyltransferase/amino-acid acetyltransferase ArgJ n=1 Tax=Ruegeria discodermiae TaxID=3064389 RepID=UPI00274093F7|nr:bifunctional glutamate N-acetyltransferase/amino-acid acetyltransferase ArgJ [Ruegeria sp. 2205SS24-7]MDP5219402.1 bifunctional glutamate N-acetyltransferase/amino-acid acetyltransferase ArgJ [Ruegeria sp. 2205SS24-7]
MATITQVSPLAPAGFPDLPQIGGVRFATAAAGVKYTGRTDVMLAVLDAGTSVAGVFTRSSTRAAPVLDCQQKLGGDSTGPAAILVNSGNANAFTGHYGQASVAEVTQAVAKTTGVPVTRVFTASTGVIGEPLPHDRIVSRIEDMNAGLSGGAIEGAAQAIMTTDTFAKGASAQVEIEGKTVSIAGIVKGSGMIAPDMATMLVYIFTDAGYDQAALQGVVSAMADRTFNCITVDSDTSTSDSLLVCATGAAEVDATGDAGFDAALEQVMRDLAHLVVRDGEGATKFIEIRVTGAVSDSDAKTHGLSVANSPLVKTAIAGEDANWGRVVMAIGKSGATADRDRLSISFGDILVAEKGWVSSDYREEDAAAYMKAQELVISIDLGLGAGKATVWTCDLTHGYIEINADYRS